MITHENLRIWADSDITLTVVDANRLRVTGPPDCMTPELQATVRTHKAEIIRLLSSGAGGGRNDLPVSTEYDDWTDAEIIELWQERSAIMEHDGGLDEKHAEDESRRWIVSVIGQERFAKITHNARSQVEATLGTHENKGPENTKFAQSETNNKIKWLPDARTPDSLSNQLLGS